MHPTRGQWVRIIPTEYTIKWKLNGKLAQVFEVVSEGACYIKVKGWQNCIYISPKCLLVCHEGRRW